MAHSDTCYAGWRFASQRTVSALVACGCLWLACGAAPAADATGAPAQLLRGQQLLARYHCGSCHAIPGVAAARGQLAASLQAYGRRSYIAGRVANGPETLAQWLIDPASIVPGTLMPAMGVSVADARDMAAYLGSLR